MKGTIHTMATSAEEAVDKIAGSQFIKNVKTTVAELDENMARLSSQGKLIQVPFAKNMQDRGMGNSAMMSKIGDVLQGGLEDGAYSAEAMAKAKNIVKNINPNNQDQIFGQLEGALSKDGFEYVKEDITKALSSQAAQNSGSVDLKQMMGKVNYYANIPKAYFNPADPKVKADRIKAAVGGYAGVAVGARVLQGGSITRDEYGQRDSAGIPFV
jgi:hypothetical protein